MAAEQMAEQVAEQVAEHLEDAAMVTRAIDWGRVGLLGFGLGLGICVGFYYGQRFNRARARDEAFRESEREVAKIREAYFSRIKPPLEEVVEEKGYITEEERPLKPPVPMPESVRYSERSQNQEWDYTKELAKRTKNHPYIIHQNEFQNNELEYTQVNWTFYAVDNVLTDERDELVVRPELIVGMENLERFGHGADDSNTVYIRNDRVQVEFEIIRTLKSYEVEVLGIDDSSENEIEDEE
jgi:hypothetical protein